MPKDAYYFSHDSNAHKDTKCIRLRRLCGMAGYGLFWCVVEMLRDAPEFKMPNSCIEDILFELRCDLEQWDALIESGLIKTDGTVFWSDSLLRRMTKYHETREQRSRAGKRSAESRASSTNVEHPLNENATSVEHPLNEASTKINKVKESKVKESKVKESKEENTHAHARTAEAEAPAEFEMFWASYPRHIDKKRALKAWKARIKDGYSPDAIHTAAKNYAAHCRANKTEEKFIKHPATFVGPDLPFLDWQKQIAIPEEEIEEDPDNGLDEWRISCMSPEQRKQYDRVMTQKQKELYDLTHPDEVRRRQANANAA